MKRPSRPESVRLIAGPYKAPKGRVGHTMTCFARDCDVKVAGFTDAPISWPFARRRGNRSIILCGDLVRAVCLEAEVAVAYHWGVATSTVYTWRKALGVTRLNKGSARLVRHYINLGRPLSLTPEARAKHGRSRKGKPPHPNFRAAALEAASRPKSDAWKQAMSLSMKRQWAEGVRTATPPKKAKAGAGTATPLKKAKASAGAAAVKGKKTR